jgi:hypothetical protein
MLVPPPVRVLKHQKEHHELRQDLPPTLLKLATDCVTRSFHILPRILRLVTKGCLHFPSQRHIRELDYVDCTFKIEKPRSVAPLSSLWLPGRPARGR